MVIEEPQGTRGLSLQILDRDGALRTKSEEKVGGLTTLANKEGRGHEPGGMLCCREGLLVSQRSPQYYEILQVAMTLRYFRAAI